MTARRLQHVSVTVPRERLEECAAFYRDTLGMEHIPNLAGARWFRFGDGDHLHLMLGEANPSAAHFALQVDDLEATLERVRATGSPPEPAEPIWGADRWFVHDPVGNRIELFAVPPA